MSERELPGARHELGEAEQPPRDPINELLKIKELPEEDIRQPDSIASKIASRGDNLDNTEYQRLEQPMRPKTMHIGRNLWTAISTYMRQEYALRHPEGNVPHSDQVCHINILVNAGIPEVTRDFERIDPPLFKMSHDPNVKAAIEAYWESMGGPVKYFDADEVIKEKGIKPFQLAQQACNAVFTHLTENYPDHCQATLFAFQAARRRYDEGWRWDPTTGELKKKEK